MGCENGCYNGHYQAADAKRADLGGGEYSLTWQCRSVSFYDADGRLHRDGAPALLDVDQDGGRWQFYFQHGVRHRLDGPAMIEPNGRASWYFEDENLYWGRDLVEVADLEDAELQHAVLSLLAGMEDRGDVIEEGRLPELIAAVRTASDR